MCVGIIIIKNCDTTVHKRDSVEKDKLPSEEGTTHIPFVIKRFEGRKTHILQRKATWKTDA